MKREVRNAIAIVISQRAFIKDDIKELVGAAVNISTNGDVVFKSNVFVKFPIGVKEFKYKHG